MYVMCEVFIFKFDNQNLLTFKSSLLCIQKKVTLTHVLNFQTTYQLTKVVYDHVFLFLISDSWAINILN